MTLSFYFSKFTAPSFNTVIVFVHRMNGCKGAWPTKYSEFVVSNGGHVAHEETYPYLRNKPLLHCDQAKGLEWNSGVKIDGVSWDFSNVTEDKLKSLLMEYGTVMVGMHVNKAIRSYASGVFDDCKYVLCVHISYTATNCLVRLAKITMMHFFDLIFFVLLIFLAAQMDEPITVFCLLAMVRPRRALTTGSSKIPGAKTGAKMVLPKSKEELICAILNR